MGGTPAIPFLVPFSLWAGLDRWNWGTPTLPKAGILMLKPLQGSDPWVSLYASGFEARADPRALLGLFLLFLGFFFFFFLMFFSSSFLIFGRGRVILGVFFGFLRTD